MADTIVGEVELRSASEPVAVVTQSEGESAFDGDQREHLQSREDIQDTWREKFQQYLSAEFCVYVLFLIVFGVLTSVIRGAGGNNFRTNEGIKHALLSNPFATGIGTGEKTFMELSTREDIYQYINQVFIPFVFEDTYPGSNRTITPTNEQYFLSRQSRLLGGVRYRIYRSKSEPCTVRNDIFKCFSESTENKDQILVGTRKYDWQSSDKLKDQIWQARFRSTYPGSGYVEDLTPNKAEAIGNLSYLQANNWIDRSTRLAVLDFNTYNPSVNIHTVGRIAFELPVSGLVNPYYEIKSWQFLRFLGARGKEVLAFSIIFLIFVAYFTGIFIFQAVNLGCNCQTGIWSVSNWVAVDLINLILYYITIIIAVVLYFDVGSVNESTNTTQFRSYRRIQGIAQVETYIQALNGFLLFLKTFKYMSDNRRLSFFFDLMKKAGQDIFMFLAVSAVFFFSFGLVGFTLFCSDVSDFRDLGFSLSNMMRFLITPLNYEELLLSNRAVGSTYYLLWGLLTLLLLLNVFIAILNEAYEQVQEELTEADKLDMSFFGLNRTLGRMKSFFFRKSQLDLNLQELDKNKDGKLDVDELMETGMTRAQAKSVVHQYDADGDGKLDEDELAAMRTHVGQGLAQVNPEDIHELHQRLNKLEDMLRTVLERTALPPPAPQQLPQQPEPNYEQEPQAGDEPPP